LAFFAVIPVPFLTRRGLGARPAFHRKARPGHTMALLDS
jgi:hypothetical protein